MNEERKLFTLMEKVEFMVKRLGGRPDNEAEAHKRNLDELESESHRIQDRLRRARKRLRERDDVV